MFWRFGGYANTSTLNTILEKPDVTLEEVLEEADLIRELKDSNSKLIEFLRDENVLRRLLEYVTAPQAPKPEEDDEVDESEGESFREKSLSPFRRTKKEKSKRQEEVEEWDKVDKQRTKLAYTASEVLSSDTWSIIESLIESQELLKTFWDFLRRPPPLDPTEAGYFTKINETLLDKKTEEMIRFLQSMEGIIPAMLNHIDCAAVMDLLLKIISMEKSEGGYGVVDWLQSQDLVPRLLSFLENTHAPGTQTSAGDFMKAIVTISANASQNEQSCIGPNNLTRQLVSEQCMENLLSNMLKGGNPLTVGVGLIIEIIRKNNSDYDPDVGAAPDSIPSSSDPIYLGTMLRCFAKRVPDFMALLLSPTHLVFDGDSQVTVKRKELTVAFGDKIEPLGFDRFKTCELMAELLHCSNMGLLNERGSEAFIKQRDEERERLREEGRLKTPKVPESAVTEFSEDGAAFTNGVSPLRPGSPSKNSRKLGIANNSTEEDGFENVGHPSDDVEDIKDDFDENIRESEICPRVKSPFELEDKPLRAADMPKPLKPRLDLDEEFVDEPLTSPRLEAVDDKDNDIPDEEESLSPHPYATSSPTSPTSRLTSEVGGLTVDEDATVEQQNHQEKISEIPDDTNKPNPEQHPEKAPPLPLREKASELQSDEPRSPRTLSPHPEDEPAPLFASLGPTKQEGESIQDSVDTSMDDITSPEAANTTRGIEGGSGQSMLDTGNDTSFTPHFEYDIDGQPMVGDYLKIMFVEHHVVPTIIDFFFRFPWNNFLHNVVYDVVQQVFNGPIDRGFNRSLAIDVFQTGRITERIVEGQMQSEATQSKKNMRLGFMGHLTLVAEEVVKFSDRHPPELLSPAVLDRVTSQQWNDYVENTLSETRERDNAILGGVRPDMTLGPRQAVLNAVTAAAANNANFAPGASAALANAGLNGGTGLDSMDLASNGSGTSNSAFGLNSGSLLSGFGSSSDEEDEEMDEIDEGEMGGSSDPFKHSAVNLSSNATPPSEPPPAPPPLNLQPSKARVKLGNRLALQASSDHADSTSPDKDFSPRHNGLNDENLVSEDTQWTDEEMTRDNGSSPQEDRRFQIEETGIGDILANERHKKPSPAAARHLDLDDFANSPAADPDDTADTDSGEDVEMHVVMH